jgi:hypothetical protein
MSLPLPATLDLQRRRRERLAPAVVLLLVALIVAAGAARGAELPGGSDGIADADGDGIEDALAQWHRGERTWDDLRGLAVATADAARAAAAAAGDAAGPLASGVERADLKAAEATGPWASGRLRVLCLGAGPAARDRAVAKAAGVGACRPLFTTSRFGGVAVLDVDQAGLRALLDAPPPGRLLLDRDGVPALDVSRRALGVMRVETGAWRLGDDGSFSLAILDSGCDTAHNDLGDPTDDNIDGPPPTVGDATDWYPGTNGWPLFSGYKVVGWRDVTDDFPAAAGPWDYHSHGTSLASVVAGRGIVSSSYPGVAPGARLVVVKFYDFDLVWHAWAGDFLAACSWLLDQREALRIGPVLMAVNWDADAGIAAAVAELADVGMTPVAAMGNYGTDGAPGWPARLPGVLTVGAVNDAGAVAAFSGRGGAITAKPDLVAPGGGMLAAGGRIECADNEPDDTYSGRWGTSLAAAHAAGALHLLDEALGEQAVHLPPTSASVRTRIAVLKLTAAPVVAAETAEGAATVALPTGTAPRADRGWGLLRVDAAAQALLVPLRPGVDQTDSLLAGARQPVVARRLDLQPGVRYLVEVLPAPGVDLELVVGDPRDLDTDPSGSAVVRVNQGGAGVSEFTYVTAGPDSWRLLAAKRLAGNGAVVLRVREAWSWPQQGGWRQLPGAVTGQPNSGTLAGFSGPSFVVPSLVVADPVARSVNVLAADGTHRAGWPVFVFPHASAQGGLNQPLLWDLDGVAGDEIVVSSAYGSVYFFNAAGALQTVNLALNRALTTPVGYVTGAGQRRVLVVDAVGNAYAWRQGPVLMASAGLGHLDALAPAVGTLNTGGAEAIVVAFADGRVTALDGQALSTLPGWPRDLGGTPAAAPVLCDLDRDGNHEVVIPVLSGPGGALVFRVLDGDGTPGPGDGTAAPSPAGGGWLAVSSAAACGRPDTGELRVSVTGLATNGQTGQAAAWELAEAWVGLGGDVGTRALPGLQVHATSDLGEISLTSRLFGPTLAWNHRGGWGTDPATLVHLSWYELLYGLTSIPGSTTAWFTDTGDEDALAVRRATLPGGQAAAPLTAVGAVLARVNDDVLLRLDAQDRLVTVTPLADLYASSPLWAGARGDGRNSGAYPLRYAAAAAPTVAVSAGLLSVQPNPGSGSFRFRLSAAASGPAEFSVYDLAGRCVAQFPGPADGGQEAGWDGRDGDGRPLPGGTYLVRAKAGGAGAATRLTIVR